VLKVDDSFACPTVPPLVATILLQDSSMFEISLGVTTPWLRKFMEEKAYVFQERYGGYRRHRVLKTESSNFLIRVVTAPLPCTRFKNNLE
jgi:hypothetical protein